MDREKKVDREIEKLRHAARSTEAELNKARADADILHKANHLAWEAYTKMLHRKWEIGKVRADRRKIIGEQTDSTYEAISEYETEANRLYHAPIPEREYIDKSKKEIWRLKQRITEIKERKMQEYAPNWPTT